ncbi:hypothetical protein Plhal304r1_c047g0129201 [Plasmopara halstedii]
MSSRHGGYPPPASSLHSLLSTPMVGPQAMEGSQPPTCRLCHSNLQGVANVAPTKYPDQDSRAITQGAVTHHGVGCRHYLFHMKVGNPVTVYHRQCGFASYILFYYM